MGRPKTQIDAASRRTTFNLESHPEWLTYADIQHLLRLYRGYGVGRKRWLELVAAKKIPAYMDSFGNQIRYKWEEVRKAMDSGMQRVGTRAS